MKLTRLFKAVYLTSFSLSLFSCSSSDSFEDKPGTVKVSEVKVSTNFDLSARKGWKFYVANKDYGLSCNYDYQIDGKTITATPTSEANTFAFSVTELNKNGSALITFMPENYLKSRSDKVVYPNLQDQSTPEKFMSRDVLRAEYSGTAMESFALTLFHENALLIFKTVGLPKDAKVFIKQIGDQTITPLQDKDEPTVYKAIILPQNKYEDIKIVVEANGKKYEKQVMTKVVETRMSYPNPPTATYFGHSTTLEFTAELTEADVLEIDQEEIKRAVFKKDWPITQ